MSLVDDLKVLYKSLPFQVSLLNEFTTYIVREVYKFVSSHGIFANDKTCSFQCVGKNNRYILYYDIGRSVLSSAGVGRVVLDRDNSIEVRNHGLLLLQKYMTGTEMLNKDDSDCLKFLYPAIEDRFEHYDGTGFPNGKSGRMISLSGRVLAVSEFFARGILDCKREDVLIAEMDELSGKIFDPELVDVIKQLADILYMTERNVLELSDDEKTVQLEYEEIYDAGAESVFANVLEMQIIDENLGIISSAAYTAVAEKTNRILDITKIMFEEVCEKVAMLRFSDSDVLKEFVIPISVGCLTKKAFVQHVKRMINKYKLNPEMFIFAVSETVLGYGDSTVFDALSEFKQSGIKIAIDNFGSEFSSLTRLDSFDFDIVKVDRAFIEKIHTSNKSFEIVKSMIHIADSLGLTVIADGVDTDVQKDLLFEIGCKYMQGACVSGKGILKIKMVSEVETA